MTVVVTIGNAEQGIANDIDSALVLGYGIYKGITGKLFARKVMPVNALQQEQCTIWLFLYQQLCLMDNLACMPVTRCYKQANQKKLVCAYHR